MRSREAPLQSAPLLPSCATAPTRPRHVPQALLQSAYFGEAMSELGPICSDDLSDSGNFDAVAELLLRAGEIISPPYLPISPRAAPPRGRDPAEISLGIADPSARAAVLRASVLPPTACS